MKTLLIFKNNYHYECFFMMIDAMLAIKKDRTTIDIFIPKNHSVTRTSMDWMETLDACYGPKITINTFLDHEIPLITIQYDVVLVPTHNDPILRLMSKSTKKRVIAIQHIIHAGNSPHKTKNIATRIFFRPRVENNRQNMCFLVTDQLVDTVAKKQYVCNGGFSQFIPGYTPDPNSLHIAVVGTTLGFDVSVIRIILDATTANVKFLLIGRSACQLGGDINSKNSIKIAAHAYAAASVMLALVTLSDYVLCGKTSSYYTDRVLSGILPVAYTCLTPVILPSSLLPGLPTYRDTLTNTYDQHGLHFTLVQAGVPVWRQLQDARRGMCRRNINLFEKLTSQTTLALATTNDCQIRDLHHVWLSKNDLNVRNYPLKYGVYRRRWQTLNPSITFHLWTNSNILDLIRKHFDDRIVHTYLHIEPHISKCDFARVLVVYALGGAYVDMDFCPVQPVSHWSFRPEKTGLFVFRELTEHRGYSQVSNGIFLATHPKNPHLKSIIERIVWNFEHVDDSSKTNVLMFTGPKLWHEVLSGQGITFQNGAHVMPLTDRNTLSVDVDEKSHTSCWAFTTWVDGTDWGSKINTNYQTLEDSTLDHHLPSRSNAKDECNMSMLVVAVILFSFLLVLNLGVFRQVWFNKKNLRHERKKLILF
jgi:mannosyltransferase OCH1-like enzyme